MMLQHTPGTGHREDVGWKWFTVLPVSVDNDSSLNWSAEEDPTSDISIDIPALLLQYLDFEGEELRETVNEMFPEPTVNKLNYSFGFLEC
jgi:hypothetical protein